MWKNMTWLAAEWRYYFEWRKLALASRLEGAGRVPNRNNPWGYTLKWMGVAIVFPLAIAVGTGLIWYAVSTSEAAAQFFTALGIILLICVIVTWIAWSFVSMNDGGPSDVVETHWKRLNGSKDR